VSFKRGANQKECAAMKMILTEIERKITPGTKIPKPQGQADFVIKGWGVRRGARARVYYP
jgi:hypothetical protein